MYVLTPCKICEFLFYISSDCYNFSVFTHMCCFLQKCSIIKITWFFLKMKSKRVNHTYYSCASYGNYLSIVYLHIQVHVAE